MKERGRKREREREGGREQARASETERDKDGDAPAEEFSLAKLGIADADPCEGFVAKHDFDTWQWYNADGRKHPPPDTAALEDAAAFTFAGDKDEILKELMSEGVARIGTISETWLQACEAFCAGNEFDNVLTLGSARREDDAHEPVAAAQGREEREQKGG
mgnify:CR=1 FL=1